jgi:UPF0755 protein
MRLWSRGRWLVSALALCACIPSWDSPVHPGDDETFVFEVSKGATPSGLGPKLTEAGLVPSEMQWKVYLKAGNDAGCIKAGKHEVRRSMSVNEVVAALCGAPLADDVPFTVVEGWRIIDIDKALADKGWITAGAFTEAATKKAVDLPFPIESPTLEGYLYPETYMVPKGSVDVKRLIVRQLETFNERFLSKHADGFGERSLHQVVVVASMLEREEPKPVNRPIVAGIIYKRLDRGFGLGIDATSRYTLPDWNDRKAFLEKLNDHDEPYNTRYKVGLPPTAIGNAAIESLEAAIKPEATPYLYYLHDSEQNLRLARDSEEHEANRRKYGVY